MPARLHGPRGPRASPSLRLGVSAAILLASLTPTPAAASSPPEVPKAVDEHYNNGDRERAAGRHASAAREFALAYEGMPRERKELRASLLFELVEAQRNAYAAGGRIRGKQHPAAHLCAAEKLLAQFIAEQEAERKPKAKKSPDALQAAELRTNIEKDLAAARADASDLDCATVEVPGDDPAAPPPEPPKSDDPAPKPAPRDRNNKLIVAGGVTAGVGLIMLGVMAGGLVRGKNADADGNALVDGNPTLDPDDPALQDIDKRGKSGNAMAIAGGVVGFIGVGVGVTLLVLGVRGKPSRVAAAPYATPQSGGLVMRWQF